MSLDEYRSRFRGGVPVAIDGKKMSMHEIVCAMNEIAGSNGDRRIDMVENRLVGVKSRECYEVPGGLASIAAHKALEDLTLEKSVLHYKLNIEQSWADCVYNGLWFSPLKAALEAFLQSTQQCVTGTVKLKFYKGSCTVVGRKSRRRRTITSSSPTMPTISSITRPRRASSICSASPARSGRRTATRWPSIFPSSSRSIPPMTSSRPRALRPPNRSARL